MAGHKALLTAKMVKDGEYYTHEKDIAAELKNYSTFLNGKTVFCNCDDPTWSNFWKYLHTNFSVLKLKKLISTHYEQDGTASYKMEYEGGDDLNTEVGIKTPLIGNGDFRSEECIEILKQSDVVITNPPFYLWIEYLNQMLEYDKKFIIIGNMNAAHNKDTFPLIQDNKIWCGTNSKGGTRRGNSLLFGRPEDAIIKNPVEFEGEILEQIASWWFTNIDIKKRHQPFFPPEDAHCYYEGNEDKYPKIINYYDGIDVNKTEMIPIDYEGVMFVPISFLDKYNPEDFEIIGCPHGYLGTEMGMSANLTDEETKLLKQETKSFRKGDPCFRNNDGVLKVPFSRIAIKNRHTIAKKDDI